MIEVKSKNYHQYGTAFFSQVNYFFHNYRKNNKREGITMEKDFNKILKTEYSEQFDEIRKNMMIMSYYKYGAMKENYEKFKCMDAIGDIEKAFTIAQGLNSDIIYLIVNVFKHNNSSISHL